MELNKTEKKNNHLLGWMTFVVALAALVYGAYEAYTYGRTVVMPLIGGVLMVWLVQFSTQRLLLEKKTPMLTQVIVLLLEMAALTALAVVYMGLLEMLENMKAADNVSLLAEGTSVWSALWVFAYRVLTGYNCSWVGPKWLAEFPLTAGVCVLVIGVLAMIVLMVIEKKQAKEQLSAEKAKEQPSTGKAALIEKLGELEELDEMSTKIVLPQVEQEKNDAVEPETIEDPKE